MTEVIHYRCDLCGRTFPTADEARDCEAQGPVPVYPRGTLFGDDRPVGDDGLPNYQRGRCFAVAENRPAEPGHTNWFTMYVCWANPDDADCLPPKEAGHYGVRGRLTAAQGHLDPASPAAHRLAAVLRDHGIDPHVWTGAEAVPFDRWLEEYRCTTTTASPSDTRTGPSPS